MPVGRTEADWGMTPALERVDGMWSWMAEAWKCWRSSFLVRITQNFVLNESSQCQNTKSANFVNKFSANCEYGRKKQNWTRSPFGRLLLIEKCFKKIRVIERKNLKKNKQTTFWAAALWLDALAGFWAAACAWAAWIWARGLVDFWPSSDCWVLFSP